MIVNYSNENIQRFEESPLRNPRRRAIFPKEEKSQSRRRCSSITTTFSTLTQRSQSMPKLNSLVQAAAGSSSRSSSPKSSSANSDQGFGGSESTSHFSSQRKRLYVVTPGRKCLCVKSYRSNSPGELPLNKGDIIESKSSPHSPIFRHSRCSFERGRRRISRRQIERVPRLVSVASRPRHQHHQ